MTTGEYWRKEIVNASETAPPNLGGIDTPDPQIVAALLVARQLRDLTTALNQIRAQLNQIEDQLSQ